MASHELEKISDYFAQIAIKINEMDPNLEKRKDQFEELLAVVDNKIKDINKYMCINTGRLQVFKRN